MIGEVLMQAKMRVGIVTPHPPGTGTLNEYAFHFVRYLRRKADVSEVILFCDDLPDGHHYNFDNMAHRSLLCQAGRLMHGATPYGCATPLWRPNPMCYCLTFSLPRLVAKKPQPR